MAIRKTRNSYRRATTRKTTTRRANGGRPWSTKEIAFLRKYYRINETAWVARQLGRTAYAVRYKASDLSIKKANPSVWRGNTGTTKSNFRPTASRSRNAAPWRKNTRFGFRKNNSPRTRR
jgi:hypothetical protein